LKTFHINSRDLALGYECVSVILYIDTDWVKVTYMCKKSCNECKFS